ARERKLHGNEHPHVARALFCLAGILNDEASGHSPNKAAPTEAAYREALAIERRTLPAQSPELIDTLAEFGSFLNYQTSKTVEAEKLLREALQIQLTIRGQRHPRTA